MNEKLLKIEKSRMSVFQRRPPEPREETGFCELYPEDGWGGDHHHQLTPFVMLYKFPTHLPSVNVSYFLISSLLVDTLLAFYRDNTFHFAF